MRKVFLLVICFMLIGGAAMANDNQNSAQNPTLHDAIGTVQWTVANKNHVLYDFVTNLQDGVNIKNETYVNIWKDGKLIGVGLLLDQEQWAVRIAEIQGVNVWGEVKAGDTITVNQARIQPATN
jgi:hypothetical protein